MAELPSKDRIHAIMFRLQQKAALTVEELVDLQSHVDALENVGQAAVPHHDTHTTPGSHYSQHHGNVIDVAGILEKLGQQGKRP